MRTAVSLARDAARAMSRLATLTQPIVSRIATPVNNTSNGARTSRTSSACNAIVRNARAAPRSGGIDRAMPSISALASAIVTPGRIRPTTRRKRLPRGPCSRSGQNGAQTCRWSGTLASSGSNSRNACGMTPMTVVGRSSTRICRPTTDGSPPKRRWKRSQPMSTVGGAPGALSSVRNVRPNALGVPSTSKKFVVTSAARSCSGSPSPVSATVPLAQIAPSCSKVVVAWRRSPRSGPDRGARGYPAGP